MESSGVDTLERRPESLERLFLRLPVGQAFDLGGHPLGFGFSKGVVLQTLRVAQPKCLALNRVAYPLRRLTPVPCPLSLNSFICHISENLSLLPSIATLPQTCVSKRTVCHTPSSPWTLRLFDVQTDLWTFQRPFELSPVLSGYCALFCTQQKLNSLVFKRFRTLCTKTGRWGNGSSSGISKEEL